MYVDKMYFDDCKNPKELGKLIQEILESCFDDNILNPKWRDVILPLIAPYGQKYDHHTSLPMHLEGLCGRARQRILYFRTENPKLPKLPQLDPKEAPHKRLQSYWDWCIEAQKPKYAKKGKTGETNKPKKKLKPLSEKAAAVLAILETLPEHKAMTGPKILEALDKKNI
nr:hypothetical protein [Phycisphaerae bacterium]NIR63646.1 hypothetical protein [candidate division Zixibacteria bacterium]NIP56417.1 hypothetical protein [Phycisphaerae bacterium]NIS54868.1 hypothetical protein [Phycisphaerae bacterium]NIU13733.1 hypothetical protein [candidate division Zixibacteria bacterium]